MFSQFLGRDLSKAIMTKNSPLFDSIKTDVVYDYMIKQTDHDAKQMFRVDQLGFSEAGSGKSDVATTISIFSHGMFY